MIANRHELFSLFRPDQGIYADPFFNQMAEDMGEKYYSFIPNLTAGSEWKGEVFGLYMRADRIAWDDLTLTFPTLTAEERVNKGAMKWVDRRFRALARPLAALNYICMTGEQPAGLWRVEIREDIGLAAGLLKPDVGPILKAAAEWKLANKTNVTDLLEEYCAAIDARCLLNLERVEERAAGMSL